ncbi:MAG: zinc metallopeptidase [Thermoguttaceae bacterium]|nr:zinc metallopeptidase [Thermoguttaceae bacterium]
MLMYLLFVIPPMILALIAQGMVSSRYAQASSRPSSMTGAAAARMILDSAGLNYIEVQMIPGHLTDHYDPSAKVIRLSQDVYQGRTLAAVGIAAHESGHAIQDAKHYAPLVMTQFAWPLASFGSNAAVWILVAGAVMNMFSLILAGVVLFGVVALYQIVNLPVEYNASYRAKQQLAVLGVVNESDMYYVRKVLGAAALTYVAAMLSALMTFLYYAMRFLGSRD